MECKEGKKVIAEIFAENAASVNALSSRAKTARGIFRKTAKTKELGAFACFPKPSLSFNP